MHTRMNPGHGQFQEKAWEKVIDSEAEVKEARAEAMEVDGAPASAGGADDAPVELIPAEVDEAMKAELEGMGFTTHRAIRALHFSGNSTVEGAINWLMEHEADIDLDEPLMIPKGKEKGPKLTPEEARLKAEDMVRKAKEKKAKEEKEMEKMRELERIRSGKEMALQKQKLDEAERKRAIDERAREKREDEAAKAKIREKLDQDRRERRRAQGLPEEPSEEEKRREQEKLEQQRQEEEKKKAFSYVKPISVIDKVRKTLLAMKKNSAGSDEKFKTCLSTLMKYIGNVNNNPDEEKFRTIKLSNPAFQQRVSSIEGAVDVLMSAGFVKTDAAGEEGEVLVMSRDKVNSDVLMAVGGAISDALNNPFFGAL